MREEAGFTQVGLAKASGVDRATINKIEQGHRSPSIETLEKLAGALGKEIADFFPKAQASLPLEDRGASSQPRTISAAEGRLTIPRATWEDLRESVTEEQLLEILKGVQDGRIAVEIAARQVQELYEEMA
jgi:transcriptional regulator with XRE-family HTH domain